MEMELEKKVKTVAFFGQVMGAAGNANRCAAVANPQG